MINGTFQNCYGLKSFELNNKKFVIGVKWHPELMLEEDFTKNLFKEFIENCK